MLSRTTPVRQPGEMGLLASPAAPALLELPQRGREGGNPWRPGRVVLTAPRVVIGDLTLGQIAVGSFRLLPNGWVEVQDEELRRDLEFQTGERETELRRVSDRTGSRESDSEYDYRVHVLPRTLAVLRQELAQRQDVTSELFRVETVLRIEVLQEELEPRVGAEFFSEEIH